MTNIVTLEDLCKTIQEQFQEGPPNGWLLNWDYSRHFEAISRAAEPHDTRNDTSFDYSFCNWFQTYIHADSTDSVRFWTLTSKLSFVAPFYILFWAEYYTPTNGGVLLSPPSKHKSIDSRVRSVIHSFGFRELPDEWRSHKIKDVLLELSEPEDVNVSKCLFCDYY